MTTWREGVEAIRAGSSSERPPGGRWLPWISRVPIVVMGGPGTGKTAIWRELTGRAAPDEMSTNVDQGYFGRGRNRRRTVAITTIPGQDSQERYLDLERYFGRDTKLHGVIFVASFGFDRIWPGAADATAAEIDTCDIEHLSAYNMRRELRAFQETCAKIKQKHLLAAPELRPKWLLVLVNKVDLYWDAIDEARQYYVPGSGSAFNDEAQQLLDSLGTLAQFQYEVLPMTLMPIGYSFSSNRCDIPIDSQLEDRHATASLQLLAGTLERLCGT